MAFFEEADKTQLTDLDLCDMLRVLSKQKESIEILQQSFVSSA